MDILCDAPGACCQTFSKIVRHDQCGQQITGSLQYGILFSERRGGGGLDGKLGDSS